MAQQTKSTHSSSSALALGVKDLYATGLYSDLTISCGGREYKVHKAILHTQSSVFRTLLSGKFKEATEDQKTITLAEDDPEVLQVLLHYFYNFTYPTTFASRNKDAESSFTVRVYALADKYDVPPLRAMAAQKLQNVADPNRSLDDFVAAIRSIEESCNPKDTTLWDIVMPTIIGNIEWLADDEKFFALVQCMSVLNRGLLKRQSSVVASPAGKEGGGRGRGGVPTSWALSGRTVA